jgi:hypothetical protein
MSVYWFSIHYMSFLSSYKLNCVTFIIIFHHQYANFSTFTSMMLITNIESVSWSLPDCFWVLVRAKKIEADFFKLKVIYLSPPPSFCVIFNWDKKFEIYSKNITFVFGHLNLSEYLYCHYTIILTNLAIIDFFL